MPHVSISSFKQQSRVWDNPFLAVIGVCSLFNTVNKYLSSENPLFFELRARYLIACERIPEAMALIKSCINHPEISKDLYFHQALFTCLFMSPVEEQLFREVLFKILFVYHHFNLIIKNRGKCSQILLNSFL